MAWLILALVLGAGWISARRRLVVVTVMGTSMVPTYHPGDRVLVFRTGRIRRGQVVVARPPAAEVGVFVIKRIAAAAGHEVPGSVRAVVAEATVPYGQVVLVGDADSSVDSRTWGLVAADRVMGVVVARLHHSPLRTESAVSWRT